jgi:hypothetical protein
MKTPRHVVIFRLVTVAITAAILITVGFGVVGRGPLGGLGARTSQADNLLHTWYARGWLG